jgi:PadR family transcriptional regulator PadR
VSKCRAELPPSTDLLQGTVDLLILKTLALEPMHGWGVAQRIQQVSREVLQIEPGSLYPALHRLKYKGWIRSEWGRSENNRRARFHSLTRTGKKQLENELETWDRLAAAIALVLGSDRTASQTPANLIRRPALAASHSGIDIGRSTRFFGRRQRWSLSPGTKA